MTNYEATREDFEKAFNDWLDAMEREIEATRESERLTAEDYAIRINAIQD